MSGYNENKYHGFKPHRGYKTMLLEYFITQATYSFEFEVKTSNLLNTSCPAIGAYLRYIRYLFV